MCLARCYPILSIHKVRHVPHYLVKPPFICIQHTFIDPWLYPLQIAKLKCCLVPFAELAAIGFLLLTTVHMSWQIRDSGPTWFDSSCIDCKICNPNSATRRMSGDLACGILVIFAIQHSKSHLLSRSGPQGFCHMETLLWLVKAWRPSFSNT